MQGHHRFLLVTAACRDLGCWGMQERNRKLVAERTRLQRELAAAAERAATAEGALATAQQQAARQGDLIATLEEDLVKAGCAGRAISHRGLISQRTVPLLQPVN